MADEPEKITLVYLRQIDEKIDHLSEDMQDVKRRITSLEAAVAMVHSDFAGQSMRIDRLEGRLDIGNA